MSTRWWEQLDAPVLGRYRIDRLLGEGGMARVFLATDVRADRPVAFKTPKIESFPPESVKELLSRFNREFRSQASDPIQGVIPIYESGEFIDADGVARPFLAMQYLSGGSLGDLLGGQIGQRAHRQTLAEVLDWLVPIARTVDRLHARKYLHRDIKPDNILFNSDGDPFLADLGIVGTLDPSIGTSTMLGSTALGVLGSPGSPGYQSPESIQADPSLRNIAASDQFSLAVTVYEALAGRLPVDAGTNQAWYGALMHWSPIALSTWCPDMPRAASEAVMKAMAANASSRFLSCSEFARALVAAASPHVAPASPTAPGPGPAAEPTPAARAEQSVPTQPAAKPMSTLNKARIGAAIMAVMVLTAGLAMGWDIGPPPDVATESTPPDGARAAAGLENSDAAAASDIAAAASAASEATPSRATVADAGPAPNPTLVATNTTPVVTDPVPPARVEPPADAVKRCTNQGDRFDNEDSIENCTKIIGLRGVSAIDKATALVNRGRQMARASEFDSAEADYAAALKLAPTTALQATAIEMRGKARILAGKLSAGEADLARARQMTGATQAEPPSWTVCFSQATNNGLDLFYTVSEPMDIANVPGWFERMKAERPDRPILKAVGMEFLHDPECTPIRGTESAARDEAAKQEAKFLADARSFRSVKRVEGVWRIRGTGQ